MVQLTLECLTISYLIVFFILFGLTYSALAVVLTILAQKRQKSFNDRSCEWHPVSILKPLKGHDDQLENNLRSFFRLDYPCYQLVFGVNDIDDPAIPLVTRLMAEFPSVDAVLVMDTFRLGYNPKVANLHNIAKKATHEHLVISDSNVCVTPEYLKSLMVYMQDQSVGMVTSQIRGSGERSLGAALENVHLNTHIAGAAIAVPALFGLPVTIGKSMLFTKSTLRQAGGLERFRDVLLEDGLLGQSIMALGKSIRTSTVAVDNRNISWSVKQFLARHLRWSTMRRHLHFGNYAAEIFSNPVVLSILWFGWEPSERTAGLVGVVAGVKIMLDYLQARLVGSTTSWYWYLTVPVKDILLAGVWFVPFVRTTVVWRGHRFTMSAGTVITPFVRPPFRWQTVLSTTRLAFQRTIGATQLFLRSARRIGRQTALSSRKLPTLFVR